LAMIAPMFYIVENYMEPAQVSKTVGPLVALLFMVKDRGVRGALLNRVQFMSQHLDKHTLNTSVFEPLCSGFNDSSPALRELTLKATLDLVPYLNAPNMEKLSRYLVRLQSDTETSIRTNAVIFIARIAPSLSEISREKMLLPAYARAMKDTFGPCRLSALQSLQKSQDLFSKADLAAKVLPATTPLLLDPLEIVRKETFQVVHGFMKVLQLESDRLAHLAQRQGALQPTTTAAPAAAATPLVVAAAPATTPTKIAVAPNSGGYLSGLSSWMSSSAKPDVATAAAAATAAAQPTAPPRSAPPMPMNKSSAAVPPAPSMANTTSQLAATSLAAPGDDGWGNDDDEEDGWGEDADDDGMEDPFANIGTKTTSTAAPTRIATKTSTMNSFGGMAMDDDPFAAIGMKTTATSTVATKSAKGKLILPKKSSTPLKLNKPAVPATKLTLDASELGDGWDDF